jgi:hypothetical protein
LRSAIAYSATTELESHLLYGFLIINFIFKNSKLLNMSSSSDSDEAVGKTETSINLTFVKMSKEYPIILSKSQVLSVQQQKSENTSKS